MEFVYKFGAFGICFATLIAEFIELESKIANKFRFYQYYWFHLYFNDVNVENTKEKSLKIVD